MISGLQHCEDLITINGFEDNTSYSPLLASCDDRFKYNTVLGIFKDSSKSGSIQLIEPYISIDGYLDASIIPLEFKGVEEDFILHPLGIESSPSNNRRIFVVNHARNNSKVEVFDIDYDLGMANHIFSIEDPLIKTPNSIVALNDNTFYVSNDHYFSLRDRSIIGKILNWLETFLRLPLGSVELVKFDENTGAVEVNHALQYIPYANGITLVGNYLAVASTNNNQVLLYSRDNLDFIRSIHLPFHVDNLSVDSRTGNLIASGHPHYPTLIKYVKSGGQSEKPQSWVVEIVLDKKQDDVEDTRNKAMVAQRRLLKGNKDDTINSILQSSGEYINSITKLEKNKDALFASGLYMDGILSCKI
ncbi:calcium-dependent phosphotriesterase [Wallemia mellicola]|uniref:Calcium-dependent phosphotriesterase n=1 Tax=Wallemia mellicola TaxID=1708541 RepID=A0A4T0RV18_9BASI|nr:hypothetical protein E3Q24_02881 [Wallemia mellicola]TIB77380.1 calcium-dependent phosphotriesterase [Wallemia mellicola]TIB90215.1 calcium-dependent phosphotriesterase [Wallemia mellicola]TIC03410.1 calcium-dependent phosphotriesterase [Wallemia mellicola]TIC15986.1 calcium-dependent phosphotriesterase [Wallemia mellicola]